MPSIDRDPSQDPVVFMTPVPRPLRRLRERDDRWMTLSRHPGPSPVLDRSTDRARRARAVSLGDVVDGFLRTRRSRARSLFTRADALFWSSARERIRDRTPPADFCNTTCPTCGRFDCRSRFLAGTGTAIPFLF